MLLNRETPYRCADQPNKAEQETLHWTRNLAPAISIYCQWTGEFRTPKKGEWYLSSSIIEGYRAPNDLTTAYHIAKLRVGRQRIVTEFLEL